MNKEILERNKQHNLAILDDWRRRTDIIIRHPVETAENPALAAVGGELPDKACCNVAETISAPQSEKTGWAEKIESWLKQGFNCRCPGEVPWR